MRLQSAWSMVLGSFGFLRRNRRQRKAYLARRRSMHRRQQLEALEQRVVLNADPIAMDDDVALMPGETAVISTQFLMNNDEDPDGNAVSPAAHSFTTAQGVAVNFDAQGNFQYQAPSGFTGVDTFRYWIDDGQAMSNAATVRIHVGNHKPTTGPDDLGDVFQGSVVSGNLLANDSDNEGDALRTDVFDGAVAGGHLTIAANGDFTFTAEPYAIGQGSHAFVVRDAAGNAVDATLAWNVAVPPGANQSPSANHDDLGTVYSGTTVSGNLLANDSDPDNDSLSVDPYNGYVGTGWLTVQSNGDYSFTADSISTGTGGYTYSVYDGQGGSASAALTWNVAFPPPPPNAAPAANQDDLGDVYQGNSASGNVLSNDSDPDNDGLTVDTYNGNVPGGWLNLQANGDYTFTADNWASGGNSYTYTVRDTAGNSATANLVWNVIPSSPPVNYGPSANDDDLGNVESGQNVTGTLFDNDSDLENDTLSTNAYSGPVSGGYLTIQTDGSFSFTADSSLGAGSYTYTLYDSAGNSSTASLRWNVVAPPPTNSAPSAVDDNLGDVIQGTTTTGNLLANDSDPDNDSLSTDYFSGSIGSGYLTVQTTGDYSFTADNSSSGTGSFSYTVYDGNGGSASATVGWNVVLPPPPPNGAPVAGHDDIGVVYHGNWISGNVLGNDTDPDNDPLSVDYFNGSVPGGWLTLQSNGDFQFSADTSYYGTGAFTYTVRDTAGNSSNAQLSWSVTAAPPPPPNSSPVGGNDDVGEVYQGRTVTGSVLNNDSDPDNDSLSVDVVNTTVEGGYLTIDQSGNYSFTANLDWTGVGSYYYTLRDSAGNAVTVNLVWNVVPNLPPVAEADSLTTSEDTPLTVPVDLLLENDSDPEGTLPVFSRFATLPSYGVVGLNGDNTLTYTPNTDFNGTDTFTYVVTDDVGCESIAQVTITITLVNDAPTISNATPERTVVAGATPLTFSLADLIAWTGTTDADGDTLTVELNPGDTAYGRLTVLPDGTYQYEGLAAAQDPRGFVIHDGQGASVNGSLTFNVAPPPNNPPTLATSNYVLSLTLGTPVNFTAADVISWIGAADLDGDTLTLQLGGGNGASGTLTDHGDGSYTYLSELEGNDAFGFTVSDGNGGSVSGTIGFHVEIPNNGPTLTVAVYYKQVDVGTTLTFTEADLLTWVGAADLDGDALVVTLTPGWGTRGRLTSPDPGTYLYESMVNGEDSFTFTVGDGRGGTVGGTLVFETPQGSGGNGGGGGGNPNHVIPTIEFGADSRNLHVAEDVSGGKASFIVTLSQALDQAASVSWSTVLGTAYAGIHYQSSSGTITFAPGQTSATIEVPLLDDSIEREGVRTFEVRLLGADGARLGARSAVATIEEDDVTVNISNGVATEGAADDDGNPVEMIFEVTLSRSSENTITINYSPESMTADSSDFDNEGGTVTFEPGETSKEIRIRIKDNDPATTPISGTLRGEKVESFKVKLSSEDPHVMIGVPFGIGTIYDNDDWEEYAVIDAEHRTHYLRWYGLDDIYEGRIELDPYSSDAYWNGIEYFDPPEGWNGAYFFDSYVDPLYDWIPILPPPAGTQPNVSISAVDVDPIGHSHNGSATARVKFAVANNQSGQPVTIRYATHAQTALAGSHFTAITDGSVTISGNSEREVEIAINERSIAGPLTNFFVIVTGLEGALYSMALSTDLLIAASPRVTKVSFNSISSANGGGLLDDKNPDGSDGTRDMGGGYRFFPDAQFDPADTTSTTMGKNLVEVRAEVAEIDIADFQAHPEKFTDVRVYFRSFDIDDPTDKHYKDVDGQDLSSHIDPNDFGGGFAGKGGDNSGLLDQADPRKSAGSGSPANSPGKLRAILADGSFGAWSSDTVAAALVVEGGKLIAKAQLATTYQPGDNFRIVASMIQAEVDALDQNSASTAVLAAGNGGGLNNVTHGVASDALYVWRKLHLEIDEMASELSPDSSIGTYRYIAEGKQQLGLKHGAHMIQEALPQLGRIRSEFVGGILRSNDKNYYIAEEKIGTVDGAEFPFMIVLSLESDLQPDANSRAGQFYQDDYTTSGNSKGNTYSTFVATGVVNQNGLTSIVLKGVDIQANEFNGGLLYSGMQNEVGEIAGNTASVDGEFTVSVFYSQNTTIRDASSVLVFRKLTHEAPVNRIDTSDTSLLAGFDEIALPTPNRITNRFADAYVEPDYDSLSRFHSDKDQQNQPDRVLVANDNELAPGNGEWRAAADGLDKSGANGSTLLTEYYWSAYVAAAFEGIWSNTKRDGDGAGVGLLKGITYHYDTSAPAVVLFLETIMDGSQNQTPEIRRGYRQSLRNVFAHELTHALVGKGDNTLNEEGHRNDPPNLLTESDSNVPDDRQFLDPREVAFIRRMRKQS